jgi:hypothetical protein
MSRGLYGQKYSGYFADSFTFFDTAAYIGSESTFTSIDLMTKVLLTVINGMDL